MNYRKFNLNGGSKNTIKASLALRDALAWLKTCYTHHTQLETDQSFLLIYLAQRWELPSNKTLPHAR